MAVNTMVIEVPMLNAAPAVAGQRDREQAAEQPDRRVVGHLRDHDGLGDDVGREDEHGHAEQQADPARTPADLVNPVGPVDSRLAGTVSGVPRAACTPRTGSPGGTPADAPFRSAGRRIRILHMFPHRSGPAHARPGRADPGRSAVRASSCSRSNALAPTSALSSPASRAESASRSAASDAARARSACRPAASDSSSARTSLSSAAVQGSSPGRTGRPAASDREAAGMRLLFGMMK